MYLDRVLVVVERRATLDGVHNDFDIRHMEAPLRYSGISKNIDTLYYVDYTPNCNEALVSYCLEKKPQVVLFSLQNIAMRHNGEPSPECISKITHELHIPTIAFWFDVVGNPIADAVIRYHKSLTLNMVLGVDGSSHKAFPSSFTNYIYAGVTYDQNIFKRLDGIRDIPVGFIGSLHLSRIEWIKGLKRYGIVPYIAGGRVNSQWMSNEDYIKSLSSLKIALNFSLQQGYDEPYGRANWIVSTVKSCLVSLVKNPIRIKNAILVLQNIFQVAQKPRYQVRGRVWEALWCRTFILEEENPVTKLYFEPYVDYVPFTTLKDLVGKVRYYLEHDKERDYIRMQGRTTVEKYYDAKLYWERLFKAAGVIDGVKSYKSREIWGKGI